MLSWVLQYLLGLKDLGHDVYFVEKYGYEGSCFNPVTNEMSDDCTYGVNVVSSLLSRFGFEKRWCFVEKGDIYHGLSKKQIEGVFATADVFIDMGTHGSWAEEAVRAHKRVWIDGEPGFTQIKLANLLDEGRSPVSYDYYFTNGMNIGVNGNPVPTSGIRWGHLFHPVKTALFNNGNGRQGSSYSTIMNWKSHEPVEYRGITYGQKNIEFNKFLSLPQHVNAAMEIAVSGKDVPVDELTKNHWRIKEGKKVTISFDSFRDYVRLSRGEFSVCKNVFVATQTGWFSDKSAAYLASGKPVVLQDTGFSKHIPCGLGVFAVNTQEEAVQAISSIESNYEKHSRAAKEIASECFEGAGVMKKFLNDLN